LAESNMAVGSTDREGEEPALLSKLTRVRDNPAGSYAVHMHLSNLRESNRQSYFITIACRAFEDFLSENDAQLYTLFNGDLVLACRLIAVDDVDAVIEKVRNLFPEDPLTREEAGSYDDEFATWHDLAQPDELQSYVALINEFVAAAKEFKEKLKADSFGKAREAELGTPLSPANLSAINQLMKRTQIADLIKDQSVYRVIPGEKGEIVSREYFIAMQGLKARVAPSVNLFASPWLFQYLTETLDKRMLAVIGKRNLSTLTEDMSLNMNIGTIMSREFQKFKEHAADNAKNIVIEFQMIDIFSDMNGYRYACDFLHEAGFRVLVDGLNPLIINYFDPSMLLSDFLKINWGPEFAGEENNDSINEVRRVVRHAGKDSVILARVDSQDAIRWGASIGITRYQGYYIDKLVMALKAQKGQG
jgi:EAL domain-containing protein (putative c-di-GMP-specific phosphodiesterase class I)